MGIIVAACVSQFHGSDDEFELLLAYNDGREIGHAMTRSAARQIADEINNAIGDGALARNAEALQRENAELREALQNLMGCYDTPLSRRRFPPDDFMSEALSIARALMKGEDDAGN